jgi:hypothetical protein
MKQRGTEGRYGYELENAMLSVCRITTEMTHFLSQLYTGMGKICFPSLQYENSRRKKKIKFEKSR